MPITKEYYVTKDINNVSTQGQLLETDSFVISGPYKDLAEAKAAYSLVNLPEMKSIWADETTKSISEIEIL